MQSGMHSGESNACPVLVYASVVCTPSPTERALPYVLSHRPRSVRMRCCSGALASVTLAHIVGNSSEPQGGSSMEQSGQQLDVSHNRAATSPHLRCYYTTLELPAR